MQVVVCALGESIRIDEVVTITILAVVGEQVDLRITAPRVVGVVRTEVWERARLAWQRKVERFLRAEQGGQAGTVGGPPSATASPAPTSRSACSAPSRAMPLDACLVPQEVSGPSP